MKWERIPESTEVLQTNHDEGNIVFVASEFGKLLGQYAGFLSDPDGETWWFDDGVYDGKEKPMWWLVIPAPPRQSS